MYRLRNRSKAMKFNPNPFLMTRLNALRDQMIAGWKGGKGFSSATIGAEREHFVHDFLSHILPKPFRDTSGDVTDSTHRKTGQIDLAIEFPFLPSFGASATAGSHRLLLAESVAMVCEVKSNLAGEWTKVLNTSKAVAELQPRCQRTIVVDDGGAVCPGIPVFAVGYSGWGQMKTVQRHFDENPSIWSIWVIDAGLYIDRLRVLEGDLATLGFVCEVLRCLTLIKLDGSSLEQYAFDTSKPVDC